MTEETDGPAWPLTPDRFPPLLKPSRVAKMLDTSVRTVERMVEAGRLQAVLLDSPTRAHLRITTASLLALLKTSLKNKVRQ